VFKTAGGDVPDNVPIAGQDSLGGKLGDS